MKSHWCAGPVSEDILRGNYKNFSKIVVTVREKQTDDDDTRHLFFEATGEKPLEVFAEDAEGTEDAENTEAAVASAKNAEVHEESKTQS